MKRTRAPGLGAWPDNLLTIGRSLALNARRLTNKTAVSSPHRTLTYGELDASSNRLSNHLLKSGIKPGDHVAVLMGNSVEHVIALYALAKIACPAVVLDPKWVEREILQALQLFSCGYVLCDRAVSSPALRERLHGSGSCLECDSTSATLFDDWLPQQSSAAPAAAASDEDVFVIMLTSGTTGRPKGCIATHRNYSISCALNCLGMPVDEGSRELIVVPIYYNSGRSALITQLFAGGTVFLRERFEPSEALKTIEEQRITCIALAPTQCNELLDSPELDSRKTDSLLMLRKAGLPFPVSKVEEIRRRITPNLYQGYGGTEFSAAALLYPHEQLTKVGSAGRPLPGVEIEIVDDDRLPLPQGTQGEIRVRSPTVCEGYYNNEQQTRSAFADGWYYSGDLGFIDDEGYLFIDGRKKDIVKTGGINVAPREIEEFLLTFPEIADVSVIGVPDPKWGEALKALIVLKEGCSLSLEEISSRSEKVLSRYKIPKSVEYLSKIPRNALGKVTADFKASRQP